LYFPSDYNTGDEVEFAERIVIREGDIITIGGQSNMGKTCWCLNFCGENIDKRPVLMGNEYTIKVSGKENEYVPSQRFINRLEAMEWIDWTDEQGNDKLTLLPVKRDYAEHVVKDRLNIIDWINLDGDRLYDISKVMDDIKGEHGKGISIIALQKGDGEMARGKTFTKDFTDCELLIDKFSDTESLLTIGKVKEYTRPVMGKTYVFGVEQGIRIVGFREVVKCRACYGAGTWKGSKCASCMGLKYIDKEVL
jgi:hypothetical protein